MRFILTMRNVNGKRFMEHIAIELGFILTMRNVNYERYKKKPK